MSSQFFGLTVAYSGLNAYQAALNTTANNIANVKTEGYSRQTTNMSASPGLRVNAKYGCAGAGVVVNDVKQIRNEYYDVKYWENQSALGLYETKLNYSYQIENYFMDDDSIDGFSTILNTMFNSLETLKTGAGDINNRQQFIGQAQNFTSYFNSMANGLMEIQDTVNEEIKSTVANINSIAEKICVLNKQINVIELQGGYANELRDQRALLIDELSMIVPTEVKETPMTNANYPDMQLGGNHYVVKINDQTLVDTYTYTTLKCVARENLVNQSDSEGLYDIIWSQTGNKFNSGENPVSGTLKGLLEVRDGNNAEYFNGTITSASTSKITVSGKLSITKVEAMTMPHEGLITIEGVNYKYTDFEFSTNDKGEIVSYTFMLDPNNTINPNKIARMEGQTAQIGQSVDAMGIPYYMAQMNEFLRVFAQEFNDIMRGWDEVDENGNYIGAENLYGDKIDYSFITGINVFNSQDMNFANVEANQIYSAKQDGYFRLTCGNVSINRDCIKDSNLIATTKEIDGGVDQYELIDKLLTLKSDKIIYRGGGADDFLQCIIEDISVDTEEAKIFSANYTNVASAIDNQRQSISGVDEDEEALDLVKFQNAYNLSSKMVSVLVEIYDQLILNTGV